MNAASLQAPALIVMGVSGSGKSTLGDALANTLRLDFIEGDDLHSPANIAKMHRGEPLDDQDRAPWLAAIGARLTDLEHHPRGVVISCSALKLAYRNSLRVSERVRFIFLDADREQIERRLAQRQGHFMPRELMTSQFDTLERPLRSESDVLDLPAALPVDELVRRVVGFLALP